MNAIYTHPSPYSGVWNTRTDQTGAPKVEEKVRESGDSVGGQPRVSGDTVEIRESTRDLIQANQAAAQNRVEDVDEVADLLRAFLD